MGSPVVLKLQEGRARRELEKFVRNLSPEMTNLVVKKTTFDVGGDIVRSLNGEDAGYPNPKRIDTGRYRAAWSMGVRAATGKAPGPTQGGDAENPLRSGDGEGAVRMTGAKATLRVTNNVEYAPLVEMGTEHMRPGHHLALAMLRAAARMKEAVGAALPAAWKNQLQKGFGAGPLGGHP